MSLASPWQAHLCEIQFCCCYFHLNEQTVLNLTFMKSNPNTSRSSLASPRSNRERYKELSRKKSDTQSDDVDGEVDNRPSASSLRRALSKANLKGNCVISDYAKMMKAPGEVTNNPKPVSSSLPLAMAKANESYHSRRPVSRSGPTDSPDQELTLEAPSEGGPGSLSVADLFFRFGRFADMMSPLGGMGVFVTVYILTAVLIGHGLSVWFLPSHPGVAGITAQPFFWLSHFGRSLGLGTLILTFFSMLAMLLFRAGHGRPPFLWVFKVVVYAVLPLTLARVYLLLELSDLGLETYFRGYRPSHWVLSAQIVFTLTGGWSLLRLIQSGESRHCQATHGRQMILPACLIYLVGLAGVWSQDPIREFAGRAALERELADVHTAFLNLDPAAGSAVETLGMRNSRWWSHEQKVRLYTLRGEVRLLRGEMRGARADMINLVRMHPDGHPMAVFGRALNFLAVGQPEEALRLLREVDRAKNSEFTPAGRFMYRIRRGEMSGELADLNEAEWLARNLQFREPNALHLEMLADVLFEAEQDRRLLRELTDAEHLRLHISGRVALYGAIAAHRLDQADLAEYWWQRMLKTEPDLAEDARAEAVQARFTNRP
jgi:hypothetical protein